MTDNEEKTKTLREIIETRQQSNMEVFLLLVKIFERLEKLEQQIQSSTST